jgi:gas vesicle protein
VETREGNSTSTTLLAFAVGAAVGAVIALLYAPASGEETRRKVREKAREGRDRVADLADDLKSTSREFLHRQRDLVDAAVEHGKDTFERVRRGSAPPAGKETM